MRALSWATVLSAVASFAVVLLAPHALPTHEVSQFQAMWGFFFTLTGLIDGLQHETTRATSAPTKNRVSDFKKGTFLPQPGSYLLFRTATLLAVILILLALATSPWWFRALVPDAPHPLFVALGTAMALALYVGQSVLLGTLSGARLWSHYAAITAIDAAIRLILAAVALLMGWGLGAFILITLIGPITWLPFLLSKKGRESLRRPIDVGAKEFARRLGFALLASGATAALINGFSAATRAWGTEGSIPMAAIIMAVLLARSPIIIPAQRFQAMLINFIARGTSSRRKISAKNLIILLLCLSGLVILGAAIGPWFMVLLWGADYHVPALVIAGVIVGAIIQGLLFITGSRALARAEHARYCAGWVVATILCFVIIALPWESSITVPCGMIIGPAIGVLIHSLGGTRAK
ncbi:MAG: hypothetical protein Q3962_06780 [Corynebacterium sp.]|nr:hypothetical protein [Corynebacterium sp.]